MKKVVEYNFKRKETSKILLRKKTKEQITIGSKRNGTTSVKITDQYKPHNQDNKLRFEANFYDLIQDHF